MQYICKTVCDTHKVHTAVGLTHLLLRRKVGK